MAARTILKCTCGISDRHRAARSLISGLGLLVLSAPGIAQPIPPVATTAQSQETVPSTGAEVHWENTDAMTAVSKGAVAAGVEREAQLRWNVGGCSPGRACTSNAPTYHPATRVIVDVSAPSKRKPSTQASGEYRSIQASFRRWGYWPYRNCFEATSLQSDSRGGEVRLRLALTRNGVAVQSRVLSSTVAEREMAECVRRAALEVKSQLSLRSVKQVIVSVRLSPGDLPLSSLARFRGVPYLPESVTQSEPVLAMRRRIETCVSDGLRRDPLLWGRISFGLLIDEEHRVTALEQLGTAFPDQQVLTCSREALIGLSAPVAAGQYRIGLRVGKLNWPALDAANNAEVTHATTIAATAR